MATPNSPVRSIPSNPNLEFDRKQAKVLLDAVQHANADAMRRFTTHHPRFASAGDITSPASSIALHDAQLVIAREYGFASWPRWKQFVETRRLDRAARAAALVKAACSNDVRKATLLLAAEPDLSAYDLYTATACGDVEAAMRLLARDSILARTKGGPLDHEPILYACFSRFLRADRVRRDGIVKIARVLLQQGADPNADYFTEFEGEKWLQSTLYGSAGIANDNELTKLLLDAGARVDANDREVLYHTTEYPDPTCLRLVLELGSPPLDQVKYCLARATDFEYPAHVALFLAAGADPNARVSWDGNRTHLHKAVYVGRSLEVVRLLIDAGGDVNAIDDRGVSILRTAVRGGNPDVIELLRSRGARDDGISNDDERLGDPMTLCLAAARDDVATIDRLLDAGADPNRPAAPDQTSPLHWAAWRGRFAAARRLVERGADIHWLNSYGGDALGTAIHGSANCFDTEGGPGMRLPDEAVAGDYPQIVEYLISKGSRLPARIQGGSEAVQDVLRRHGVPDLE
jgi:ankyrin repeat protein